MWGGGVKAGRGSGRGQVLGIGGVFAKITETNERTEDGAFGYVVDPERTLIELWEPASSKS